MPLEIELDLEGQDETSVEYGENWDVGWHGVTLDDAYEDAKGEKIKFRFVGRGGKFDGKIIHYEMTKWQSAPLDKQDGHKKKMNKTLQRMGLIKKGDYGQRKMFPMEEAIGEDFAVKIEPWASDKNRTSIGFGEVYALDHPNVPPEVGGKNYKPPEEKGKKGETRAADNGRKAEASPAAASKPAFDPNTL